MFREHRFIITAILIYIAVFSVIGAYRHYSFQTQTWDMGLFDQLFWNTLHGRFFETSIAEVKNHLGVHWSPALLLLLPFYAVFPSPYTLLLLQTIALGVAAWPLYLFALRVLGNKQWARVLALLYLAYPALHWVNMFDFHEIAFVAPLIISALYFLETARYGWAAAMLAVAANLKEDAILAVLFVGIYWFFRRNGGSKAWSIATIVFSLCYFALAAKVFMPQAGGGLLRIDRYANLGSTPAEIVNTIIFHPLIIAKTVFQWPKFLYLFWLFLPVGFLPFFAPLTLLLAVPGLAENLLTAYDNQFASLYQYDAILIPAIFVGAVYGLKNLLLKYLAHQRKIKMALYTCALAVFVIRSPINPFTFPFQLLGTTPRWEAFREMAKLVPPGVSVTAHTNIVPHLTRRERIYMLGSEPAPTDYVLIDGGDLFGFANEAALQQYADNYMQSSAYDAHIINNRYIVLKKKNLTLGG